MIDLSGTKYRLEGIHDHEDAMHLDEWAYFHVYLRVYESAEDKECCPSNSRAVFTLSNQLGDTGIGRCVKCGLLQTEIEGAVDGGACAPITTADSLDEAVMKLITIHQLSGAGLDTDKLQSFLQEKQRADHEQ